MASASLYPSSSQSQSRASQSQSQTSQASSRTSISSQQQPLRPCLKTSGSSHSRKRPSADTTPTSSSPTKKPKSSVKWREGSLEDIVRDQEKSTALVREEIRHALSQPQQSRKNACWEIKEVFTLDPWNEDAPAASLVAKHLLGLSSCSSMLGQSAADLVHAALDSWWVGREESFVIIYLRFLGSLVSAHTGYTKKVLEMLVRKFLDLPRAAGELPGHPFVDRTTIHDRIHTAVKYILQLVPRASDSLPYVLAGCFPFITSSTREHVEYTQNLLKITDYAPEVRWEAIDLIMEKVVKLDVHAQMAIAELDEDIEDFLLQGTTKKEVVDPVKDENDGDHHLSFDSQGSYDEELDDDPALDEEDLDPEERRPFELRAAIKKMDYMLDQLFTFYAPAFDNTKPPNFSTTSSAFDSLLSLFRKTVLPTYRSRHTQFLLFRFAQTSPDLSTRFIEACLSQLQDSKRPVTLRVSAAAYIASFVARGARVDADTVLYTFDSLARILDAYRNKHLSNSANHRGSHSSSTYPSLRHHTAYYAAFQSLLYIFCFRWRDLLDDPEDYADDTDADLLSGTQNLIFASGVKEAFQRNIPCSLNPLKVCAPEIVEEFAKCTHYLGFLYIWPKIDANKRLRLSTIRTGFSGGTRRESALTRLQGQERFHQLDAYFPFDPYRLPRSKKWVAGSEWYVEYKGMQGVGRIECALPGQRKGIRESGMSDIDDEDDGSEEDDEEDEVEDMQVVSEGTETPESAKRR